MRSSLLGSLVGVLRLNLSRKATRVRVYEAGRAFTARCEAWPTAMSASPVSRQTMRLAGLASTVAPMRCSGARKIAAIDFFDLKGDIEALLAPRSRALRGGRASGDAPRAAAPASNSMAW